MPKDTQQSWFERIPHLYLVFLKNGLENASSPFFLSYHNHLLPSAERKKDYVLLGILPALHKGNWKYPGHSENRNHSNEQVPTPFSVQVFPKSLLSAKLEEKLIEAGS